MAGAHGGGGAFRGPSAHGTAKCAQGSAKTEKLSKLVLPSEPWAHAAIAARGAGTAAPRNEKPHRSSSWTSRSCYRCGSPGFGLGSGVGSSGVLLYVVPGKARVLFVLRQTRQTATAIAIPGKTIMRTFGKETPLPQQTRERHVGGDRKSNNRLPQARRCSRPLVFRLAGYSRGQVGNVTSPIQPDSEQFDNHVD